MPRSPWAIVVALSITETITWGIVYYGFAVFLRPMETAIGASRTEVTGAFSLALGVAAASALPVGRWIDRFGSRALMTVGSCAATLLMLAWSRVETLTGLYVVWCLMGLAMAATLYEPAFATVVAAFPRGRDRALTIVTLAGGLASTIFMPIEAVLLDRLGWRPALVVLAMFLGVTTIPLHALLLGGRRAAARAGDKPSDAPGVSLRGAAGTPIFWVLGVAYVVANFAVVAVTVHLIPYLVERGYAAATAAAVVGWIGATQLLGRIVFAPVSTRLSAQALASALFFLQAAGLLQLAALWPSLLVVVVMLGVANGMSTLARASNVAEIFGRRHYGTIAGALALAANGGRALGPLGASLLHTAVGSYPPMFATLAGGVALAGVAVALVAVAYRHRSVTDPGG